jgi:hypothetical protein
MAVSTAAVARAQWRRRLIIIASLRQPGRTARHSTAASGRAGQAAILENQDAGIVGILRDQSEAGTGDLSMNIK